MNRKVLVVGYFGEKSNKLDGQTIKTRSLYHLLKKSKIDVDYFDTESVKYSKLSIFKLLYKILLCDDIFYLPAQNNLRNFFPYLYKVNFLLNKEIYYFMIGGWLPEFLNENKRLIPKLKSINKIFCETKVVKQKLESSFNFNNTDYFPNFREFVSRDKESLSFNIECVKFVYLGRVAEAKGIMEILKIEKYLESNRLFNFKIDIYGPIASEFELKFMESIKKCKYINYLGKIEPIEIQNVLDNYDVMLFPTKSFTEGLPGTVIDSFVSGLPVVASNWKHAEEFLMNKKTGFIFDFNEFEQFNHIILQILNGDYDILKMKKRCLLEASLYSETKALEVILNLLTK